MIGAPPIPLLHEDSVAVLSTSVSVSLASDEKDRLARAAKAAGLSMSAYGRQAILRALGEAPETHTRGGDPVAPPLATHDPTPPGARG